MSRTVRPRVSVLLPVRNAASTLPRTLESLSAQSFRDWEAWIIDDGSTDDTAQVAAAHGRRDPRFRLHQQPALGLVAALRQACDLAQAPCWARLDADDECHPDRLGRQLAFLEDHPDIGLVSSLVRYGGDPALNRGYALHVAWLNSLRQPEQIRLARFIESPFAHPSVLFRRTLVDRLGGYREGPFPEDYELWLRWLEAGVNMAKVEAELLVWNDPPHRLSRTDPRYHPDAFFQIKAPYLARAVAQTLARRQLWIWGAGRLTRRRAAHLETAGLRIHGYIDIDPRKCRTRPGGRPVIRPEAMPPPEAALVVTCVTNRGARELIRPQLLARGYVEGRDCWIAG